MNQDSTADFLRRILEPRSRRDFLCFTLGTAMLSVLDEACRPAGGLCRRVALPSPDLGQVPFVSRGIVILPQDLTLDWPSLAHMAGLTTIALHAASSPSTRLVPFIRSDDGKRFLDSCCEANLDVEFEMHAVSDLLPRALFSRDPTMFRANEKCERTPDANLCVHSTDALAIAADNAVYMARTVRPTTHRYYFWGDDGAAWCRCASCAPLQDSDQALVLENTLMEALRSEDPDATVAHLSYTTTAAAPREVAPRSGVFLEFAPATNRRYDISLESADAGQQAVVQRLKDNLSVFPGSTAKVLEYWMDDSMFSGWTKPQKKLPFEPSVIAADLRLYRSLGIRNVSSFGVFLDASYAAMYGEPPIQQFGSLLAGA